MKRIIKYALWQAFFYSTLISLSASVFVFSTSRGIVYLALVFLITALIFFFITMMHWYSYKRTNQEDDYWLNEAFQDKY